MRIREKLNTLTGWQRLWFVITVIYILALSILNIESYFSISYREKAADFQFFRSLVEHINKTKPEFWRQRVYTDAYRKEDESPEKYISRIKNSYLYGHPDLISALEREVAIYESAIDRYLSSRNFILKYFFLIGLVPLGFVYFCAAILRWIYRGFRPIKGT